MYFLSEEEKRWVQRHLAPEVRRRGVADDLRGWNWHQPPLSPIFDTRLGVSEVAGQYCPTGRDLYLRRVLNERVPPTTPMRHGSHLHGVLSRIVLAAKRSLYGAQGNPLEALAALAWPGPDAASRAALAGDEVLLEKEGLLWAFEYRRLLARTQEALARQPGLGIDALVHLALPVIVEQRLDGSFLGLSSQLSADAFVWSEQMVVDLKFGAKEPFHRLSTTGYALAIESLYEYPVNLGCLVYVSFRDGQVLVERDLYAVDDELRQWFIESRDERARLVEEEIDPGLPAACPESCPYLRACHPQ